MTHTLHRVEYHPSLNNDFVVLVMPSKDINHVGSGPKLRKFMEMALEKGAVKVGDARKGNQYFQGGLDKVLENCEDRAVVHAVFNDMDKLVDLLKAVKEADLGMSVVVSGLFHKVEECINKTGLEKHTINQSLGRWGRVDRLPDPDILQFNCMCGHGMVSVSLIEDVIGRVKSGDLTPAQGAEELFKPCMCGIFNTDRAAKLLKIMAKK